MHVLSFINPWPEFSSPVPPDGGLCHYGTLPGGWMRSQGPGILPQWYEQELNKTFPVWQPYCPSCQLKPLLAPYLAVSSLDMLLVQGHMQAHLLIFAYC